MKKLILSLALTTVVSAFATDKDPYAEYGGEISLWPKDPGLFLFVNAQTKLADEKLAKPIKKLADEFYIDIRAKKVPSETFDIRKSPAMLKSYGAKGGIWVVDDPLLPVSLAAIEDGWGILNVAPLLADAPADAKLDKRLVKIVNRLFGEIHGVSDPTMMPACVTKQAVGLAGVDELEEAGEGVSAGGAADVDCDQYPPKRLVTEKVSHADSIAEKAMFRVVQSDNGFLGLLITRWLASGASI